MQNQETSAWRKQILRLAFLPALCLAAVSCSTVPPGMNSSRPTATSVPSEPGGEPSTVGTPSMNRHVQLLLEDNPLGIPMTDRCYKLKTERVVFAVFFIDSDNRADWDEKAKSVGNDCNGTRAWDDKWHYYTLPDDTTKNLMLVWRNIDRREYGYVVIKNTPAVWLVYSNSGGPWTPKNGEQIKRTWHSDGTRIDIDVYNPRNKYGWTANHIWVSFGY